MRNLATKRELSDITETSLYELNKEEATFTLGVFTRLLDVLNKTKRNEAKYVLLVKIGDLYEEISYFKNEFDANYSRRKLRKISRLAFNTEFALSVEKIKDL